MAEGVGLGYILEPEWADDEVQGRAPVRAPVPDRQTLYWPTGSSHKPMPWMVQLPHRMQTTRYAYFYVVGNSLRSKSFEKHPSFEAVCLTKDVLEITVLNILHEGLWEGMEPI
jgi:hypothetical protein